VPLTISPINDEVVVLYLLAVEVGLEAAFGVVGVVMLGIEGRAGGVQRHHVVRHGPPRVIGRKLTANFTGRTSGRLIGLPAG